ncbi:KDEL-tailed cysteine endopeptidase CEP1 [Forsythia ovata]|uniref:KDEL-tailed cysteine endopeptidase CEP1 n=1 Tax=Forsythia ovata TaxID=205694 RepID=A0ABD1TC40_9LAMI
MGIRRVFLVSLLLAMAFGLVKSLEFTERDLSSDESLWDLYERWRSHHTVSRDLTEKRKRFNVFKANVLYIHKVNQIDRPYKLKLNKFADMTSHEFRNYFSSKIRHYRMLRGSRAVTGIHARKG